MARATNKRTQSAKTEHPPIADAAVPSEPIESPKPRRSSKRKTKAAASAAVAGTEVAAPLPGTATHVKLNDLWEMRLAQMERRALQAEAEVARMTKLYALEKLDKKGIVLSLEKKMATANKAAELAETRSLLAKKRMEGTIGRPLANVSIDPDTGEVVIPE